ncbi:hypothetical protein Tco_0772989 [Tanacetum coccineum]|uniref:Reverse transcriptase domain-containing protein n=1 Tax=Tanacetum coccineum TaxID=301880 RepID=A0ABQ4ZNJ2_9ASTR
MVTYGLRGGLQNLENRLEEVPDIHVQSPFFFFASNDTSGKRGHFAVLGFRYADVLVVALSFATGSVISFWAGMIDTIISVIFSMTSCGGVPAQSVMKCMTRSSTNKLFMPFKDLEREFCSSRKLFKTLSLEKSRSPKFNLFFDIEENSEEEVTETMAETMEEYMSKTRANYGSGIARPKIDDKDHFKLKGQFLKELRDNTFSGSDHEDANKHIEKVREIVDLFHIPNITQDQYCPPARIAMKMEEINNFQQEPDETLYQAWEIFKELLMKCPQHYLIEMQDVILFYNGLEYLTRQILDLKGVIATKTTADAKAAIQEMAEYSQKCHNGTSKTRSTETFDGLAAIQEQLNNLGRKIKKVNEKVYAAQRHEENSNFIKEIRASTDAAIRNQGASIKTLEIQIRKISKVLQKRGFGSLPSSTETNLRDHVKSISTTVEADMTPIRHIGSSQYAVSAQQNSKLMFESRQATIPFPSHLNDYYCDEKNRSYKPQCLDAYSYRSTCIDDSLPQKEKDLGSFTLPCYINNVCFKNALADLGASISVMPLSTYLNLGLGELAHTKLIVELVDITVKHPKGIAKNVLLGIGKFVFPVDFIILDMLEDVKVPLILERPFLSTAHAKINVFKRKITLRVGDEKIFFKSVKPASSLIKRVYMLSLRERIELDLEARLMGETLVLKRSLDLLYGDYIELNDLNVPLELRRDQVDNLMPIIKEGEVFDRPMIDEARYRNENKMVSKIIRYPNGYNKDQKICIGYAYNLKFSCMVGFELVHANFFPNLPINVMSKRFYNSIMKDKIEFRGRNELGNFANVFIGNFYVITDFIVVEDMDPYLDKGMGEVEVGEPF